MGRSTTKVGRGRRLVWFVGLWAAGVLAVTIVASFLKLLLTLITR